MNNVYQGEVFSHPTPIKLKQSKLVLLQKYKTTIQLNVAPERAVSLNSCSKTLLSVKLMIDELLGFGERSVTIPIIFFFSLKDMDPSFNTKFIDLSYIFS